MTTDAEQFAKSGGRNRLGTIALLFSLALPAMMLMVVLPRKLGGQSTDYLDFPMVVTLPCSLIAVVCGLVARAKDTKRRTAGSLAIVIGGAPLVILVFHLYLFIMWKIRVGRVQIEKSGYNLIQVYAFMNIYAQSYNCYPSMQPPGSTNSGGARDLYPLYLMAVDKPAFLTLLRPPSIALTPFSTNPSPDEFDSDHIGYIYNSLVTPDESGNPPLMAERCVEDGMFSKGEKPVFKDRAHILMDNGTLKKVPVKNGKLILGDIKLEDLEKLK